MPTREELTAKLIHDIPALMWLPGKSACDDYGWLPTWIHLMDTAGVIDRLLSEWLPSAVVDATQIEADDLRRVCRFLALTHDIGKMTPLFAARLAQMLPDVRSELEKHGITSLDIKSFDICCSTPHARAGSEILRSLGCHASIASVVGAHHGKPQERRKQLELNDPSYCTNYYGYTVPEGCKNYSDSPEGRRWASIWRGWTNLALAEVGYDDVGQLPQLSQQAQVLVCGLLIMADWIASNTRYFPLLPVDERGDDIDIQSRLEYAMTTLQLPDCWSPVRFAASGEDFENEFGFRPNEIQQAMIDAAAGSSTAGIYILEAPMGCGKTEAALAAAEVLASKTGCGGIFFGLPTQATANGIFGRITAWAEHQSEETRQSIRLAHGMAELNTDYRELFGGDASTNDDDESGRLVSHPWFKGNKQALLADFVIGTVDQLLMAALKQKHVMLRHLGLAGKVVIIDECHAYDAYMNKYLDTAIRWLGAYHVPVILLSATLPSVRRTELIDRYLKTRSTKVQGSAKDKSWTVCREYPLLTWTDGADIQQQKILFAEARRHVAIERIFDDELVDRVSKAVAAGGCTGVIVNIVARAQAVAHQLRTAVPEAEVLLFHSHFTMHDRAERERDLLARIGKNSSEQSRQGLVVVGTQVLEQSLDIDFDYLVTDLCPMDLLLQRIGRLQRHQWRKRPEKLHEACCAVLGALDVELEHGSKIVYGEWPLLMARDLLPDVVRLPDDIADLVQDAYDDRPEIQAEDHKKAHADYVKMVRQKKQKADTYCLPEPSQSMVRTIDGMLSTDIANNDKTARAAVRDGIMSISVIIMMHRDDDTIGFLTGVDDEVRVDAHHMPPDDIARQIATQRVTLPYIFTVGKLYDVVVEELERVTGTLTEWKRSPWLYGELILLFNENMKAELSGYELHYDREQGLTCTKIEIGHDDERH